MSLVEMRAIALGLAEGHIDQADRLLCDPWRVAPNERSRKTRYVVALEHMRSAAGWLMSAVNA